MQNWVLNTRHCIPFSKKGREMWGKRSAGNILRMHDNPQLNGTIPYLSCFLTYWPVRSSTTWTFTMGCETRKSVLRPSVRCTYTPSTRPSFPRRSGFFGTSAAFLSSAAEKMGQNDVSNGQNVKYTKCVCVFAITGKDDTVHGSEWQTPCKKKKATRAMRWINVAHCAVLSCISTKEYLILILIFNLSSIFTLRSHKSK